MATTAWLRGPAIGCGVTATVSIAASVGTGDIFAVKSSELSRSALLQREQSILSSFKSPYILSFLGFDITPGSCGGLYYNLFLEYAAAGTLSDEIKRCGGRLGEDQIRLRAREILSGLVDLHGAGIIHCDVKPDNVLIGSNGRAKIGDLGCARLIASGEREIRGSPMYMAPEAVRGEEQGMPADVWALGCAVVEMATGRPPWPDVANAAEGIRRIGFSGDVPVIPDWFSVEAKEFVINCLRTNPRERWTADELLCHPFIGISSHVSNCADLSWVSPKSALDFGFWDSMGKLHGEEDDEDELISCEVAAMTRIQELAESSVAPDWSWDGDWVDVRNIAGESAAAAQEAGVENGVRKRKLGHDGLDEWRVVALEGGGREEITISSSCGRRKGRNREKFDPGTCPDVPPLGSAPAKMWL
ncbi:Mitogen-activated protein kinase kinase kinase NPK1 [Platanthera guangdongensis]|uniref:Mitogen-activated protein kinase kinase kinase NPK1 n=1 Tax=Platanthera guangdongensis TaxID=2320717 RepID=A0ABR2LFX0_9ASPA